MGAANAVELTVEQAWLIADTVGAGSFPWVLAITPPFQNAAERARVTARVTNELIELGVWAAGGGVVPPLLDAAVTDWISTVCFPDRWLELRFVGRGSTPVDMLRGLIARRGDRTVVALRSAQLVTFTAMDIDDPRALVPVLTAGLTASVPARFTEFALPARVGARADERLRAGAELAGVLDYLGIPESGRRVVESVFMRPRSYVEVVAGRHVGAHRDTTDVGVAIVDTAEGRVLVAPSQAFDGEWISRFSPGTPSAIASAVENLTATLPDGRWFVAAEARDFVQPRT